MEYEHTLSPMWNGVEAFNYEVLGIKPPEAPTALTDLRRQWAATALREEADELRDAETLEDKVDALLDYIYFALGRVYELGYSFSDLKEAIDGYLEDKGFNPDNENSIGSTLYSFARKFDCTRLAKIHLNILAQAVIRALYALKIKLTDEEIKRAFYEVQQANMTKQRGELSKRPGSMGYDAIKPEGWTPPDLSWLADRGTKEEPCVDTTAAQKPNPEDAAVIAVLDQVKGLITAKGQDYNSSFSRDEYFPYGHISYLHMLHTKLLRCRSIASKPPEEVNFEGLIDSVVDLIAYSAFYASAIERGAV